MYCTFTDVRDQMPDLSASWGAGRVPSQSKVEEHITEHSSLIDSYLSQINPRSFTLPLSDPPPLILKVCRDLTVARIRLIVLDPRADADVAAQKMYDQAMTELSRLSRAPESALFPAAVGSADAQHVGGDLSSCPNPVFRRDSQQW
jgi:phage gp36-like protein